MEICSEWNFCSVRACWTWVIIILWLIFTHTHLQCSPNQDLITHSVFAQTFSFSNHLKLVWKRNDSVFNIVPFESDSTRRRFWRRVSGSVITTQAELPGKFHAFVLPTCSVWWIQAQPNSNLSIVIGFLNEGNWNKNDQLREKRHGHSTISAS